jgi:hypothetical protein
MADNEHSAQSTDRTRKLTPRAALPFAEQREMVRVPWMAVLRAVESQQSIEFQVKRGVTLGRVAPHSEEYAHIDLSPYGARNRGVSRLHALIRVRDNCLSIQDMGSTNGTFLNGYQVMPFTDVPLEHDDVLELGHLQLKLTFVAKVPV